jgi:SAM-dependent methyltransferase
MADTREPQYQRCVDLRAQKGLTSLGLMSNQVWEDDPRRLGFVLARYRFVAKMFSGLDRVLEVGCADAFATRVVLQEVGQLTAVDFDPVFVRDVQARMDPRWSFECKVHDLVAGPVDGHFDGAYAIDVLEHIAPEKEDAFVRNMAGSLSGRGIAIIGVPSIHSQAAASPLSRAGHVNCKDAAGLKATMSRQFHHVFIFSMNDEVVHTGFYPMAQYLIALCVGKRR